MRSSAGAVAIAAVALFLGVLVVAQFRSREVYSGALQNETPESLASFQTSLDSLISAFSVRLAA